MLKRYACTPRELTCIIGNLFTEIRPICGKCDSKNIAISGMTYAGETATVFITKDGFLFEGNQEPIENIRESRCIFNGNSTNK